MLKQVFIVVFLFLSSGCTAYKVDVQQGNVLTKETMDQLKVGMSEIQVQALLGTPLINDPFQKDRWDFVYSMTVGTTNEKQYSYISLFFKDRKLAQIKVHKEPVAEKDLKAPGLGLESRFLDFNK